MNNVDHMYLKTEILGVFTRTSLTLSESIITTKRNFEDAEISQGYRVLIRGFQIKPSVYPFMSAGGVVSFGPSKQMEASADA